MQTTFKPFLLLIDRQCPFILLNYEHVSSVHTLSTSRTNTVFWCLCITYNTLHVYRIRVDYDKSSRPMTHLKQSCGVKYVIVDASVLFYTFIVMSFKMCRRVISRSDLVFGVRGREIISGTSPV